MDIPTHPLAPITTVLTALLEGLASISNGWMKMKPRDLVFDEMTKVMAFRRRWMAKSETPFPQRLRCDANERVACRHENPAVSRKSCPTTGSRCDEI